ARAAEAAAKRQARIDEIDAQIAELQPLADGPDRRVVSSGYVQETRCVSADPVSGACRTTATGPVRQTKTVGNAYKSEAQAEIQKLQAERARLLAAP
ncbi:MAG: hypothetical protein KC613_24970, partial [Myxococcales bacterium]|nr:hypothetical protein [Myxococcales bacterium]